MSETAVKEEPVELTVANERQPRDIGRAARQGGAWAVITYSFTKVTGFASSIVLARILMPEHFGLIAMVNTVLGLVQMLGNCGIGFALIHQRKDVQEHANTTWWLDLISGVVLFALANALAPAAALYYREPYVRLLIVVASANFLIAPIGGTMGLLLSRELRFKETAKIDLAGGSVTSSLTIVFALLGAGVWSFVLPGLASTAVVVALRWRKCSFRPRRAVCWRLARKLLGFGRSVFGASVFDYINQNVDYILVGMLMGGRELGFYIFAYTLGVWVVQNVSATVSSVAFPTFASVQDDPARARAMFLKLIRMISLIGFPIVCLQWALAQLYVSSIYGDKWLPSVTAFRLIALYGIGRAVCAPGSTLIAALGRPDISLKLSAGISPVLIASVIVGSRYGMNGVAAATAAAHGLFVWLYVVVPFRILRWNPVEAARALWPAFLSSAAAAAVTGWVYQGLGSPVDSLGLLAALLALGACLYIGLLALAFRGPSQETIVLLRTTLRESRA